MVADRMLRLSSRQTSGAPMAAAPAAIEATPGTTSVG